MTDKVRTYITKDRTVIDLTPGDGLELLNRYIAERLGYLVVEHGARNGVLMALDPETKKGDFLKSYATHIEYALELFGDHPALRCHKQTLFGDSGWIVYVDMGQPRDVVHVSQLAPTLSLALCLAWIAYKDATEGGE